MSVTPNAAATTPDAPAEPGMSVVARSIAIFVRPTQAWGGLRHQVQFWFPMLLMVIMTGVFTVVMWDRAIVPDMHEGWQTAIDNGQATQEQIDKTEAAMNGPVPRIVSVVSYGVFSVLWILLLALGTWFGVGFILGTKFSYRLALEVAAWSALITIPATLVTGGLAWSQESLKHATLGLGTFLPDPETPSKLMTGVRAFLNFIGPFTIWSLIVSIFGAATLSGAPRKSVAWVSIALFLVFALFGASMAALFGPAR